MKNGAVLTLVLALVSVIDVGIFWFAEASGQSAKRANVLVKAVNSNARMIGPQEAALQYCDAAVRQETSIPLVGFFANTPVSYEKYVDERLKQKYPEDTGSKSTGPSLEARAELSTKFQRPVVETEFPQFLRRKELSVKKVEVARSKGGEARVRLRFHDSSGKSTDWDLYDFYLVSQNGSWKIFQIRFALLSETYPE